MGASGRRATIPGEQRVFSLVLALVASPQGVTKRELLSSVYGYAERDRGGHADAALDRLFERDKAQLRELGIPLETLDAPLEPGNNQQTRYRISKHLLQMPAELRFDDRELALLRAAALAWSDGSLSANARRAVIKLEALGAGREIQHLGLAPQLGMSEAAAGPLHRAIAEELLVELNYQLPDRPAPLLRRLAPLGLHRADGRWHLIAYDVEREAGRVFLLSRIIGPVRVLTTRTNPTLFELLPEQLDELHAREHELRAQVRVQAGSVAEARLAARAQPPSGTVGGAVSQAHGPTDQQEDAGAPRIFDLGTLDFHALAAELASYGEQVTVVQPASLRMLTVDLLHQVRDAHAIASKSPRPAQPLHPAQPLRKTPTLGIQDRVILLLALVPYLREHGPTPVADLATVFDTTEATIRSLIEFLGTAGIPGETLTYQPDDLFDIDWDAFEQHDLVSLTHVVAVDDTPRFSAAEHSALLAGLHSLRQVLPASELEPLTRTIHKLRQAHALRPLVTVADDPVDARLSLVFAAVEDCGRLRFGYRDVHGRSSERTVSPLRLAQGTGGWYLRAYCEDRQAERTFLIDAMRDLERLPGPGVSRAHSDDLPGTAAVSGPHDHMIASEAPHTAAIIRVRETAVHRIAPFAPRSLGAAQGGWIRAEVGLTHAAAAIRLVQTAPGDVEIESPATARQAVREWADRALAPYDT